jgi:hypothetical protein
VLIDYCDQGPLWDPVLSAYFYHLDSDGLGLTSPLPSGESPVNLDSFFFYKGLWGDLQYADDDPRQKTVPKFGLKRFVSGPTGPIDKQLLRKGLFPDPRARHSWLEWAVGVFMFWYPCCVRGWRKWMSCVVVLGLAIATVYLIRYCLNRWRRKEYSELRAEIPMEDDDVEEGVDGDEHVHESQARRTPSDSEESGLLSEGSQGMRTKKGSRR